MPRLSIYVPEALKARIDSLKDDLNLSEIACRAFEIKIGELAQARKERDMSAVIERLRASKLVDEAGNELCGRKVGRAWAEQYASYADLTRIARLDAEDWEGHGTALVDHVTANNEMAADFWANLLEDDLEELQDDADFLRGFILGAQDVHNEVADQL